MTTKPQKTAAEMVAEFKAFAAEVVAEPEKFYDFQLTINGRIKEFARAAKKLPADEATNLNAQMTDAAATLVKAAGIYTHGLYLQAERLKEAHEDRKIALQQITSSLRENNLVPPARMQNLPHLKLDVRF